MMVEAVAEVETSHTDKGCPGRMMTVEVAIYHHN